jgi:hypothetical protein
LRVALPARNYSRLRAEPFAPSRVIVTAYNSRGRARKSRHRRGARTPFDAPSAEHSRLGCDAREAATIMRVYYP